MKRVTYIVGIVIVLLFMNIQTSFAEEEDTLNLGNNAKSSMLIEQDTGMVLYEKNAHEKLPPASMTKVMTLLLVMEAIENNKLGWDEKITVSEYASSMGGSQIFLDVGEQMTVEDLVKGIAIASGNDASVALAERIAGSESAFVAMMNEKVKQLNLENTKFQNSSGLPAKNHYSSAYDMAMIAKELLKYEKITKYTAIYEDYLRKGKENEFWLVNTNKLVRFYPEVDGLKTGYTSEAKFCLTATAKKDGMRVIAVTMGADSAKNRNSIIMDMIHYAFNHYEAEKLFDKGEELTEMKNLQTENLTYDVVTSQQISVLHKKGEKDTSAPKIDVHVPENYQLLVKKGEQVGTITISKDDDVIHESPLVLENDMEKASLLTLFKRGLFQIVKIKQ